MIIVFDLDYTLLDTKKFMEGLAQAFGITYQEYLTSLDKYFINGNINFNAYKYNAYRHISYLLQDGTIKKEKSAEIKKELLKHLKSINQYLFPEAEKLLEQAKEAGHKIILMTYGDPVWQGMKINYLKINKYFGKIILTDKEKEKVVDFLKKENDQIILVNDNAQESLEIKKQIEKIKIILIKSPYSNNTKHNFKVCELKDVWREIKHGNQENKSQE